MFVEEIAKHLTEADLVRPRRLVGCSAAEIQQIEELTLRALPTSYKSFMRQCGRSAGRLMRDIDLFYPAMLSHQSLGQQIVEEDSDGVLELPEESFVFGIRQGEDVLFFQGAEREPPVWLFREGEKVEFTRLFDDFNSMVYDEFQVTKKHHDMLGDTGFDSYAMG